MSGRWRVLVVVVLVGVACSPDPMLGSSLGDGGAVEPVSTSVPLVGDVTVDLGVGELLVPEGSVSAGAELVVEAEEVPVPEAAAVLGGPFDVSVVDGVLEGEVVFTLDVEGGAGSWDVPEVGSEVSPVWLAHYDTTTGEWEPIETSFDGEVATARVDHLSVFGWFSVDVSWVTDALRGLFDGFTGGGLVGAPHPDCDGQEAARDRFEIVSDEGAGIMWCYGVEEQGRVLRVTNNRLYAVALSAPDGFVVADAPVRSGVFDKLGPALERIGGDVDEVLTRGDTVTFSLGDETQGTLVAEASPVTGLADILETAVGLYASITGKDAALIGAAVDSECVASAVADLFGDDLSANMSAAVRLGFECAGDAMRQISGWAIGGVVALVGSVVSAAVVGIGGAINAAADTIFGNGTTYTITINGQQEWNVGDLESCPAGCRIEQVLKLDHPEWGEVFAVIAEGYDFSGVVSVFDRSRSLRWSHDIGGIYHPSAVDGLDHLFIMHGAGGSGAHLTVFMPILGGFEIFELGSQTFGYFDDFDQDDILELAVAVPPDDCYSCTPSTWRLWRWTGETYEFWQDWPPSSSSDKEVLVRLGSSDLLSDVVVSDEPYFSGCTPGSDDLPDGLWFGQIIRLDSDSIDFDLVCFHGIRASDDSEEWVIVNNNPKLRTLRWANSAIVFPLDRSTGSTLSAEPFDTFLSDHDIDFNTSFPALVAIDGGAVIGARFLYGS